MESKIISNLVNGYLLNEKIELLAAIDATDTPFISCYLDIRSGKDSCFSFIHERAKLIRPKLSDATRLDFEEAFELVHDALNREWNSKISGLAIFARGVSGGRFLSVIPLAFPFEQRMEFCRVPDIRPLLQLRDEIRPYTLLRATDSGIDVVDIGYGPSVYVGRIIDPLLNMLPTTETELNTGANPCATEHRPMDLSLDVFRRLLTQKRDRPLVLAGHDKQLNLLRDRLPGWLKSRLEEILSLPADLCRKNAERQATEQLAAKQRSKRRGFAADFIDAYNHGGEAVSGTTETIGALHAGVVDILLVTASPGNPLPFDRFSVANRYIGSLTGDSSFFEPDLSWDPAIELCRIAYQHGIDIIVTDAEEIAKAGGVGGVLKGPVESQVMPLPAVEESMKRVA